MRSVRGVGLNDDDGLYLIGFSATDGLLQDYHLNTLAMASIQVSRVSKNPVMAGTACIISSSIACSLKLADSGESTASVGMFFH